MLYIWKLIHSAPRMRPRSLYSAMRWRLRYFGHLNRFRYLLTYLFIAFQQTDYWPLDLNDAAHTGWHCTVTFTCHEAVWPRKKFYAQCRASVPMDTQPLCVQSCFYLWKFCRYRGDNQYCLDAQSLNNATISISNSTISFSKWDARLQTWQCLLIDDHENNSFQWIR